MALLNLPPAVLSDLLLWSDRDGCGSVPRSLAARSLCIFDFEAEAPVTPPPGGAAPRATARAHQSEKAMLTHLHFLGAPVGAFAAKLHRDVRSLSRALLREEERLDAVVLATRLAAIGYRPTLRTALGAPGLSGFSNLRHEFCCVHGDGDYEGVEFIVEPCFRPHFEVAAATARYRAALEAAPEAFVGTAATLVPLLQALCAEMSDAFDAAGLALPPWRRAASLQTKWLPARARDVPVGSHPAASARLGSPEPEATPSPSTSAAAAAGGSPGIEIRQLADSEISTPRRGGRSLLSNELQSAAAAASAARRRPPAPSPTVGWPSMAAAAAAPAVAVLPSAYAGQPAIHRVRPSGTAAAATLFC